MKWREEGEKEDRREGGREKMEKREREGGRNEGWEESEGR